MKVVKALAGRMASAPGDAVAIIDRLSPEGSRRGKGRSGGKGGIGMSSRVGTAVWRLDWVSRPGSVAALGLLLVLLVAEPGRAAETPVTREAVVAAIENGPGAKRGRLDAPVTIVEFSDFQCSFCRKFWRETLPRLDERYIQTGKVRFVYRHLAILGPPSVQAANAAECAGEQGRFWPYHDLLFERVGPFAFTDSRLKGYAGELRLDGKRFGTCVDEGRYRKRIEQETLIGQMLGMTGTPSFLINGRLLIGAHPFETFVRVIEEMLAEAGRPGQESPRR
jgi:protein-disulfide isomerase